jgi:vancomycin resistance protein VanW
LKKVKRSKLRLFFGRIYFVLKKNLSWYFPFNNYAHKKSEYLPFTIFSHQSLLHRRLRNVDMWMQENKIQNLKIAISKLDKLIIEPNQKFSYWRQIGLPSYKKGYIDGMILSDGKVISGVGGGLCQLSNLIYWMTLHTPLTVVERWRHSYDVFPDSNRKQPFGSGATCSYPNIDLQIANNTKQKFQLKLHLTDTHLVGEWISDQPINVKYEVIEKDHSIKQEYILGYVRSNVLYRKVIDLNTNKEIITEFLTSNQALMMYDPYLEV